MKYIICERGEVIIFSRSFSHLDVAKGLNISMPVSAGFVTFSDDGVSTYGESLSLGIGGRPDDHEKIARQMIHLD
jgi:hypothetical protein